MGAKAEWLMANHPLRYGYGPASPLSKLCEVGGKVVHIGSDFDQTSLLHYAEHIAPVEHKRIVNVKSPFLVNGAKVWIDIEEFDTSSGIRKWPYGFFETIVEKYIAEEKIPQGKIGDARSVVLPAQGLVDFSLPIIVEQAQHCPA